MTLYIILRLVIHVYSYVSKVMVYCDGTTLRIVVHNVVQINVLHGGTTVRVMVLHGDTIVQVDVPMEVPQYGSWHSTIRVMLPHGGTTDSLVHRIPSWYHSTCHCSPYLTLG